MNISYIIYFIFLQSLRDIKSPLQQSPQAKAQLECRFAQRRKLLTEFCNKFGQIQFQEKAKGPLTTNNRTRQPTYSMCTIPKIGSTFWRNVNAAYKKDDGSKRKATFNNVFISSDSKLVKSSTMFTFVRNPYIRLLSGYADKLYSINPAFWNSMGRPIMKAVRSRTDWVSCAHDITFAELVDYLIYSHNNKKRIDPHLKPIHEQCGFCEIEYTYIGKMETFLDDMVFMTDAMGILDINTTREATLTRGINGNREMIYSNAHSLFHERRDLMEKCGVSLIEGLRVTWKRWQIRGMISIGIPFPLKADDIKVTFERFNELAQKAHNASDPNILHEGKNRALREAYGSLTYDAKVRLMKMFEPEFEMFDYDPMPDFVFGEYQNNDNIDLFHNKYM